MKNKGFKKYVNSEEFDSFSANLLYTKLKSLSENKKKISIALSGGFTPLPILSKLKNYNLDWGKFFFFMVDERNVSIESSLSNYGNIKKALFSKIKSSSYPMLNKDLSLENCVIEYEELLKRSVTLNEKKIPVFDLIILGMGDDGHTASLFPNTKGLDERSKFVIKNWIPQINQFRITITFPVILNADQILLLVKGEVKKNILNEINEGFGQNYPIFEIFESHANITSVIGVNKNEN